MELRTKCAIFLGLVFGLSWPVLVGGWLSGHHSLTDAGLFTLIYVASPGLAAVLCTLVFERGRRVEALGLRFRPNVWWLWAIITPCLAVLGTIAVTYLLSSHPLASIDSMVSDAARLLGRPDGGALSGLAAGLALSLIENAILCSLTEELGWRGYLYHVLRPSGFWPTALGTGFVWGLWHWPMIYLYGVDYPDDRIAGLVAFPIYTMLWACLITVVRDRGGSVWPAGIMHGAMNTFALLFVASIGDLGWPWGVAGIGGIVAIGIPVIAIWFFDRSRKPQNSALPAY